MILIQQNNNKNSVMLKYVLKDFVIQNSYNKKWNIIFIKLLLLH